MSSECKSLRGLIKDWFGDVERFRVTRPECARQMPWRAVKIEVLRSSGPFEIVFFKHDDGSWWVYPPPVIQPTMNGFGH